MKQAEAHTEDRTARRDDSRRRALLYRRIGAVVLVLMAVALFIYIFTLKLNSAVLMWGSAGVLLLIEALLLWVDLPVSKALQGFLGVLCICLLAYGFLDYNYELVDGRFVPKYAVQARIQVTDEYPQHFEHRFCPDSRASKP